MGRHWQLIIAIAITVVGAYFAVGRFVIVIAQGRRTRTRLSKLLAESGTSRARLARLHRCCLTQSGSGSRSAGRPPARRSRPHTCSRFAPRSARPSPLSNNERAARNELIIGLEARCRGRLFASRISLFY
jgi:hypothetical protein